MVKYDKQEFNELLNQWTKSKIINPLRAEITLGEIGKYGGKEEHVFVDCYVKLRYNNFIRAALIPLYIISGLIKNYDIMDWCEDVAYFKCFTQKQMNKKRKIMDDTRDRVISLVIEKLESR